MEQWRIWDFREGAQTPTWVVLTYWQTFCQKLNKNERHWTSVPPK